LRYAQVGSKWLKAYTAELSRIMRVRTEGKSNICADVKQQWQSLGHSSGGSSIVVGQGLMATETV